jgi:hypothetical protein
MTIPHQEASKIAFERREYMEPRKPYRKRGKRDQEARNIAIQIPRDLNILEDLYHHRTLTIRQIEYLHFGSNTRAQERVAKLLNHEFISQIFMKVEVGQGGSNPLFNVIGQRGVDLLRAYRDPNLPWYPSYKDLSDQYLHHTKLVNDTLSLLIRACRDAGYGYPERGTETKLLKRTEAELKADRKRILIRRISGEREDVPFTPDAYLTLSVDGKIFAFFIEADRGKEKSSVIKEKIRAYHAYFESGMYLEHYKSRAQFRVLFVTEGDKRLGYLHQWANEEQAGANFWFAHMKHLSRASILHEPVWWVSGWNDPAALFR